MGKIQVFENAHVLTMDDRRPYASGVVVDDGMIVSLDPEKAPAGAQRIDCQSKTLIPGFIDTHIHLHAYARKTVGNDLSAIDDLTIEKVRAYIAGLCQQAQPGQWITIFGYDPYLIAEQRLLTRWDIDDASKRNPVRMYHRSGQGQLCNSKALEVMGINIATEEHDGGLIDREVPSGEPNGMLYGMDEFISSFVPGQDAAFGEDAARAAGTSLAKQGVTCVHDATLRNDFARIATLESWHDQGLLPQRVRFMVGIDEFLSAGDAFAKLVGAHPACYGVKLILNQIRGWLNISPEDLAAHFTALEQAGVPGMIHCVDEEQLDAALDAIEAARRAYPGKDVPHRIEHASLCSDAAIERMARLKVMVSSQPAFLYYSGDRYLDTIDERDIPKLYRFGSLAASGINVSFSSDAPIAPVRPMRGIYSAVTRKSASGRTVAAAEAVSVEEALKMHTINAARALAMQGEIGSLEPGKYADMVLLSEDPLSVEPARLKDIGVEMTVIGGQVIWQA